LRPLIYQLNLSRGLGGAEIYTHSFCRALRHAGWRTELIVHRDARFWRAFDFGGAPLHAVSPERAADAVPRGAILVVHGSAPEPALRQLAAEAHVVALAHHTLSEHNRYRYYEHARWLLAVSRHVIATLHSHGLQNVDPHPLYGVANVVRGDPAAAIAARSPYEWDTRKARDRVLSGLQPLLARLRRPVVFRRRPGVTLGIVSRIADIKQFPALFDAIAPALAARPQITIEVFGAGPYAKVRAFERSLAGIRNQVRFWGWQSNIAAVFANVDYLMTGLPEREALGLNVIEAQACGVPVLAVDAGPFDEIVLAGKTGHLYRDPREDGGADFARCLDAIALPGARLDPRAHPDHLARFSMSAFAGRVDAALRRVVAHAEERRPAEPA
jgi:glycosyltransferase involved in cell wall biosynthesis